MNTDENGFNSSRNNLNRRDAEARRTGQNFFYHEQLFSNICSCLKKHRANRSREKKVAPKPDSKAGSSATGAPTPNRSDEEKKAYEERLQRRLKLLRQYFEEGRIKIARGLKVADSLMAIKYAPDGSVDLNTVDGLVRSLSLAIEGSHEREESKKAISLTIQAQRWINSALTGRQPAVTFVSRDERLQKVYRHESNGGFL